MAALLAAMKAKLDEFDFNAPSITFLSRDSAPFTLDMTRPGGADLYVDRAGVVIRAGTLGGLLAFPTVTSFGLNTQGLSATAAVARRSRVWFAHPCAYRVRVSSTTYVNGFKRPDVIESVTFGGPAISVLLPSVGLSVSELTTLLTLVAHRQIDVI